MTPGPIYKKWNIWLYWLVCFSYKFAIQSASILTLMEHLYEDERDVPFGWGELKLNLKTI
jgi:hypothetical protein